MTTKNSTFRFGLAENDVVDIFSMSNFFVKVKGMI